MRMTREYFDEHVEISMEFVTPDGGHFWEYGNINMIDLYADFHEPKGNHYQGMRICLHQTNENVRKFLNMMEYNRRHHPVYAKMELRQLINKALKTGLEI